EAGGRGEGCDRGAFLWCGPLLQAIDEQLCIGPQHQAKDIPLHVSAGGVERLGHDVKIPLHDTGCQETFTLLAGYRQEAERASRSASALLAEVWLPGPSSARSGPPEQVVRGSTRRTTRQNARRPDSAPLQYLRQPLERQLVPLARAPAVAARVLGGLVGDARLAQTVAQQPVAPLQVVVVVATHVQQDAGQFAETVQTVTPIDDWIEAQPAVPDLLDQLAARKGDGQVDVERRVVQVGRVTRRVRVDDLGQIVAFDRAGWRLRPDAVQVVIEKCLVRHVQKRVARKHRHGPERARIAGGEVPCPATSRREAEDATARRVL